MDPEACAQLTAAGCGVDAVASAPEDFGPFKGDAKTGVQELIVGASGTLEQQAESDHYHFPAAIGQSRRIEAQ